MDNREIIENLVNKAPGVRSNKDLLEEMICESIKRAESFLENNSVASSEAYLKKIVNTAVVDIIKNADSIRAEKAKKEQETKEFQYVEIVYTKDEQGKILYNTEIEFPEEENEVNISDNQIQVLKDRINKLDREYPAKRYKQIFELRFLRDNDYQKTAEKLEMQEKEVLNVLQEIFTEVNSVLKS